MSEESTLFEDFLEYCNEDNEQLKKDIETWLCDFFDIPNRETPLDQYEQDFIRANLTPKNQLRILGAKIEDTPKQRVYTLIEDEETRGEFGTRVWKDEDGNTITEQYNEKTGYWDVV